VRVQQRTAPTGAEALTAERDQQLGAGEFTKVPNDAHWCVRTATEPARVLIISTSVARTAAEQLALTALAPKMRLRPQRQLFANQKLTVSLRALHPLLPLRRTLPANLQLNEGSALVVLSGTLEGQIISSNGEAKWQGELSTGSLIELPADTRYQLRAAGRKTTAVLVIEPRLVPTGDGKEAPFSPFVDG
jgi:quercetin dioxygenase-like cupin family protein